ncbi:hypothetical protein OF83DRAFT_1167724 [Amylostereum chailletii]|nr:hypothetical protein OF83DRAFT_1167724 [Amylostereum chailletii]
MSQSPYNDYYGNGGGGGGYLTGGSPFGGSASGSPGGAERRGALQQSLRAVTVKQLLDASQTHAEAPWTIEGKETGHITLVGQVITVRKQATNAVYWLDDGTGRIEARHWHDSSIESTHSAADEIEEKCWIRATGSLKMFNNKRHMSAVNVRRVTDFNEIFFHLSEVMVQHIISEKGGPPGAVNQSPSGLNQSGATPASAYAAQPQGGTTAGHDFSHLPPVQRGIVEYILAQPDRGLPDGIHIGKISKALTADADAFSNALEQLFEDGHIYQTSDDTHIALAL